MATPSNDFNFSDYQLDASQVDPDLWESHQPYIEQLSKINNSAISVFDFVSMRHIYASAHFQNNFHLDFDDTPDDYANLSQNILDKDRAYIDQMGLYYLQYVMLLPKEERLNYKMIADYRLVNKKQELIRVVEQHIPLVLSKDGEMWLSLSMLDISMNQDLDSLAQCVLIQSQSGEEVKLFNNESPLNDKPTISKRELEVLDYLNKGLVSKEIAEKLYISVHTVNTHRQRIIEKMNVKNTTEAVGVALKHRLI